MHIRAQGTNMSSCNGVSHIVRLLFPGWCWNVHVVPRVTARPARVFRTGDPETLRLCAAACEHRYWHDTMLYWRGGLRIKYFLSDVSFWSRPPAGHHLSACSALSGFLFVQALTRHVPKHVSQASGWFILIRATRARACRCMRASPLCRFVKPRPRVLRFGGVVHAHHADAQKYNTTEQSECPRHQAVMCHDLSACCFPGWRRVVYVVPCLTYQA